MRIPKNKLRLILQALGILIIGSYISYSAAKQTYLTSELQAKTAFRASTDLWFAHFTARIQTAMAESLNVSALNKALGVLDQETFRRFVEGDRSLSQGRLAVFAIQRLPQNAPDGSVDVGVSHVWGSSPAMFNLFRGLDLPSGVKQRIVKRFGAERSFALPIPKEFHFIDALKSSFLFVSPITDFSGGEAVLYQVIDPDYFLRSMTGLDTFKGLDAVMRLEPLIINNGHKYAVIGGEMQTDYRGEFLKSEFRVHKVLDMDVSRWEISLTPSAGHYVPDYSQAVITLSVCLFLTFMVVYIFWIQTGRAQRVMKLVEYRTKALTEAHEELEEHYKMLQHLNLDLDDARKAAETANKAKSEFLATMSHELRTPLNAILGFSQLLTEEALGPIEDRRYVDYAKDIHGSGTHLLSLINDILDLAKLEAGKVKIENKPLAISDVINRIYSLFGKDASDKNLNFITEVDTALPEMVLGDELRLRQILINFVSNAMKFTDSGSITIYAKRLDEKDGPDGRNGQNWWQMGCRDTGIGVPKDSQESLFDRFTQVDTVLTREHGGVGLGLAICKELAYMMNGAIHIESEEGKGTHIWITLPLVEPQNDDYIDDHLLI